MGQAPELLQRRHTTGRQLHEKVLNITNYQGYANQNHSEKSPHTCQSGCHQNSTDNMYWQGCGEKVALCLTGGDVN